MRRTNWAGNLTYGTDRLHLPETIEEVQEVVRTCRKVRALGSRHSFNAIADSTEHQVCLERLKRVVELDETSRHVTIEAGVLYGELCPFLDSLGFALHNLASLPHISVVGSCATATHGSGTGNGNLATAVSGIEFVAGDGSLITLSRGDASTDFEGAVVNLGGIGVVTRMTLDLQPAFVVAQDVYLDLPLDSVVRYFEDIVTSAYSVSLFSTWANERIEQVWVKSVSSSTAAAGNDEDFFGARRALGDVHPISGHDPRNCTSQMGRPGRWYERLPHFRMEFTPSSGAELQSEYFVDRRHGPEAIGVLNELGRDIAPLVLISEVRTVAADDLWMSPAFKQDVVAFHFTWRQDWDAVSKVLPLIERELAPFSARPHWGKLFTMTPAHVRRRYSKVNDFRKLLGRYDPSGKFRNCFLEDLIFSL